MHGRTERCFRVIFGTTKEKEKEQLLTKMAPESKAIGGTTSEMRSLGFISLTEALVNANDLR